MRTADRPFISHRALYILLAMSIASNIIIIVRVSYPKAIENLRVRLQAQPVVTPADHIRGNANATGTVIVYTDYQCPFCARLHATMLDLSKTSDFRWIYRHFPLDSHPYAEKAAEAAECGGEQGKFWEYSDGLFDPKFTIEKDSSLRKLAATIGLESKAFENCLASGRFASRVAAQRADGIKRRMAGTPTFFVNGTRFEGAILADQLRRALQHN